MWFWFPDLTYEKGADPKHFMANISPPPKKKGTL